MPKAAKCTIATCWAQAKPPNVRESCAKEYACCFKTLADPMRIRILNLLASNDEPVCVVEIVKRFPIQQPSISHHLKILRDCRFVLAVYDRVNRKCLAEFPHAARDPERVMRGGRHGVKGQTQSSNIVDILYMRNGEGCERKSTYPESFPRNGASDTRLHARSSNRLCEGIGRTAAPIRRGRDALNHGKCHRRCPLS
jgi:DNA-binding transcriptional ArsR family regulator